MLTIAAISYTGLVNDTGLLFSGFGLGTSFIGSNCYDGTQLSSDCLQAPVSMVLNFDDFHQNSFELALFNLTT